MDFCMLGYLCISGGYQPKQDCGLIFDGHAGKRLLRAFDPIGGLILTHYEKVHPRLQYRDGEGGYSDPHSLDIKHFST